MDRHVLVAEGIPPWLAVWWRLFTWWFMVGIGSLVWLPSPEILKTRVWLYLHHSFIIPSSGEWLALLLKGWSGWGSLMVTGSGFIALKLPMNDGAGITLLSPSLAWPRLSRSSRMSVLRKRSSSWGCCSPWACGLSPWGFSPALGESPEWWLLLRLPPCPPFTQSRSRQWLEVFSCIDTNITIFYRYF